MNARTLPCLVSLYLLTMGCSDGRGGGSSGPFESDLLSKSRAIRELSLEEQRLLCREVEAYLNDQYTAAEWERLICIGSTGIDLSDPAACEARVEECLATGEYRGYDYTYSTRCGFRGPRECSLSIEDIERCAGELATQLIHSIDELGGCESAGMPRPEPTSILSEGCRIAYEETDCGCVLAASGTDCNPS